VSTPTFHLPSFAKINWSLRILGRRTDGYHEVRTVLQTISLQDELRFSASESREILLSCTDPSIPLGEENLIIRAANALRVRFNSEAGATIHLEKRIPAKGGLGGASSNAAIALLGLARLWALDVTLDELIAIGSGLGADVPFFLLGGRVLAAGTGTELEALDDIPQKHLILISPNATVSTAAAYESLKAPALTTLGDGSILSSFRADEIPEVSHLCALHNDFEDVVFRSEPEIARAKAALLKVGAGDLLLAGSGSSVFGIFDNEREQERALGEIQAEPGWRVFPAVTVSRQEYQEALGTCGVPWSSSKQSET
jgi:4-diphosphocytidyl-2-C-methyl-D-erythritol kinase